MSSFRPPPCSRYEFTPLCSSPSYCVRKCRSFIWFSMIRRSRFARCAPVRISTVAVSLATEHRQRGARYSLTAVSEALTISMLPP